MGRESEGYSIRVEGVVQGVGFRPFVWRLARRLELSGCVYNQAGGVVIELQADPSQLQMFLAQMQNDPPALARIAEITCQPVRLASTSGFQIEASRCGEIPTGCASDAVTCDQCHHELFDPLDRRYRYPFINCTECGPRLSILREIPYDRATTTMAPFTLCKACEAEYHDPADRRFHAQPNACPDCGPRVWLEAGDGREAASEPEQQDPFEALVVALLEGKIVAVKGLGGFHLVCDATNPQAVARLRHLKRRPHKPFALMVRDLDTAQRYADVGTDEARLLTSAAGPVVLLSPRQGAQLPVAPQVAPGQRQWGIMLPTTPIHHLLMASLDRPLVMTSGNPSGAPMVISNAQAREQLGGIADRFLMHDREIANRVDDSVVRWWGGQTHYLRRARGYAPLSLTLPAGFEKAPALLGLGAEMKSTLCLLQSGSAVVTPYLGDLDDARCYADYHRALDFYRHLYRQQSRLYATDMHPEYRSAHLASELVKQGAEVTPVQHHHAHLAACLGENGYPLTAPPVLGICLDGSGYGTDGTLWGGEFLLGGYRRVERVAHFRPFPLPGGAQAIREPWRLLFSQLVQAMPDRSLAEMTSVFPALAGKPLTTLQRMMSGGINCPITSSCGRLFDAVAAALDCCDERLSYEGQAAMQLEALAWQGDPATEPYRLRLDAATGQIDPAPLWQRLWQEQQAGSRSRADRARAFHKGLVNAIVEQAVRLRTQYRFDTVALTGGVMQNRLLWEGLQQALQDTGLAVMSHRELPPNDGCIAFGQALVAVAQRIE